MGGERFFYSGADSASATGAAGRSDLEGLLSVSMGSSGGWKCRSKYCMFGNHVPGFSSAAASIFSSEASTTSAGAFS